MAWVLVLDKEFFKRAHFRFFFKTPKGEKLALTFHSKSSSCNKEVCIPCFLIQLKPRATRDKLIKCLLLYYLKKKYFLGFGGNNYYSPKVCEEE